MKKEFFLTLMHLNECIDHCMAAHHKMIGPYKALFDAYLSEYEPTDDECKEFVQTYMAGDTMEKDSSAPALLRNTLEQGKMTQSTYSRYDIDPDFQG